MLRTPCLLAGLLSAAVHAAPYEPYVPATGEQVLLRVAPDGSEAASRVRALREAARAAPGDVDAAVRFAHAAIERARATADPRWYGQAESVLVHWEDAPSTPVAIRVLRATIAQHRHRFEQALAELDAVIAEQPGHPQARVTRAVIHSVQARYQQALRDCAALLRVGELLTTTCMATPRSLSGEAEAALAQLDRALARAPGDAGTRLWALTVAAEIADRLNRDDADARYQRALAAEGTGRNLYLKLAYADFLLHNDRPDEVAELLPPYGDTTEAQIRILRARAQQGEPVDPGPLRARLDAIRTRGSEPHYREEAMTALHLEQRPAEALWLARENWRQQREPLDALLLLQAALSADDPSAAAPVRRWMRDNGVQDHRLQALREQLADTEEASL
jgi:tetratricopeptide (TPR) repeat protein